MYEARCGRTAGFEEMHGNQGLRSSLARCKKEESQWEKRIKTKSNPGMGRCQKEEAQ